jgi:hypothetical protein
MRYAFTFLIFSLLYFAGCGTSDKQPEDRASLLLRQSMEEMNRQNFDEAERLVVECITLHSEEGNESKLTEDYSTLSTIQILSGKLTPALETLSALRELHRRSSDRPAELQTMLQTANIYFRLGKSSDAVALFTEIYNTAKLFRLGQIAVSAASDLSHLHMMLHQNGQASAAALNAYASAKELQHTPSIIEALKLRMRAAGSGIEAEKAYAYYREASALIIADSRSDRTSFTLAAGDAFSAAGEWNFARQLYEAVIPASGAGEHKITPAAETAARIGLGELFLHHYAYTEAQQQFISAHTLAQRSSDPLTQAYLLIRIADCLSQRKDAAGSIDGIIRAEQLYEQAMTLAHRNGFPCGEAIALHRLGRLKEMNGDDNGAVTFYKRAFDRFVDQYVDPLYFTGTADVSRLMNSSNDKNGSISWFSNDLILLLLKYNRVQEAFAYMQTVRRFSILTVTDNVALRFSDPTKDRRVASLRRSLDVFRQTILESYHASSGTTSSKNRAYRATLQQQIEYARSKVFSDAVTLSGEFPSFAFLTSSKRSVPSPIIASLPASTAAAEYFIGRNQAWAFVFRPHEEITAVELSSFGYALTSTMDRFTELLTDPASVSAEIPKLAGELYGSLLRPLDLSGIQRVIIIPPMSLERFPFHALG